MTRAAFGPPCLTMIDLILLAAIGGAFYLGFKAGNKYTTLSDMLAALKKRISS